METSARDFGPGFILRMLKDHPLVGRIGVILSIVGLLAGCASSASTTSGVLLNQVAWCGHPTIAFQDDGVTPAATITDWATASPLLGFAPALPTRIPTGACLVSAGGVVRDPVFGGRFTIIYALSQAGALSIAETPSQQSIPTPQCSAQQGDTGTPLATCQQTLNGLNVTIFSSLSIPHIRALLEIAQPASDWVPTTSGTSK